MSTGKQLNVSRLSSRAEHQTDDFSRFPFAHGVCAGLCEILVGGSFANWNIWVIMRKMLTIGFIHTTLVNLEPSRI